MLVIISSRVGSELLTSASFFIFYYFFLHHFLNSFNLFIQKKYIGKASSKNKYYKNIPEV